MPHGLLTYSLGSQNLQTTADTSTGWSS